MLEITELKVQETYHELAHLGDGNCDERRRGTVAFRGPGFRNPTVEECGGSDTKISTLNVLCDYFNVSRAVDYKIKVLVKSNHVETMKKSLQFLYFYIFV